MASHLRKLEKGEGLGTIPMALCCGPVVHLDVINQSKESDLPRICLLLFCCQWEHFFFDRRRDRLHVPDSYDFMGTRLYAYVFILLLWNLLI